MLSRGWPRRPRCDHRGRGRAGHESRYFADEQSRRQGARGTGARWMIERGGAGGRPRFDLRGRSPRHAGPVLPERADPRPLLAEWGDAPVGLPVPAAAVESGARGRAGRDARHGPPAGASSCSADSVTTRCSSPRWARRPDTRPSAFEESLSIVRRLKGEAVSRRRALHVPRRPRWRCALAEPVEYWIGASRRSGIDRAARRRRLARPRRLTLDEARGPGARSLERCKATGGRRPPSRSGGTSTSANRRGADADDVKAKRAAPGIAAPRRRSVAGSNRLGRERSARWRRSATPTSSCAISPTTSRRSSGPARPSA